MEIGVPKEIKNHEYRVGLLPASVRELTQRGHRVFVEAGAGSGAGFADAHYTQAGAVILDSPEAVFEAAELIVKVKEPLSSERALLTPRHTLFTYLHLAPDRAQTDALLASQACCIAYETVTDNNNRLPLLAPMSEVAGRMSIQAGAMCLERSHGGKGVLLGGVPGVERADVVILGGGVVGRHAAAMAIGLGARVSVFDKSLAVLRGLDDQFGHQLQTRYATQDGIETAVRDADLIIGSVLVPGASAPKLVTDQMVQSMSEGTVLVDVAIDQGGCFETSRPTTHQDPYFELHGVVHYCVANMPGAVPKTSSAALNHATLPFVLAIAEQGVVPALKGDHHLRNGLATFQGKLTSKAVAAAHQLPFDPPPGLGFE
jgi:alanine dehydrogenase